MSIAIVTLSFDEGAGWSEWQLNVACMLSPWFFFVGQITTFSALFTKLRRVDQVLQFRRRAVTIQKVIGPLVALLTITLVILIFWTVLDPWTWERKWISQMPAETYGQCHSDHLWAFFGPLAVLIIVSEALAAFFAWKTADVPEALCDTPCVVQAIGMNFQAWVVGVPILAVLGESSAEATYLGRVLLIWIFAVSCVAVVVGPKVYQALQLRRHPELLVRTGKRVSVSGIAIAHLFRNNSSTMFDAYPEQPAKSGEWKTSSPGSSLSFHVVPAISSSCSVEELGPANRTTCKAAAAVSAVGDRQESRIPEQLPPPPRKECPTIHSTKAAALPTIYSEYSLGDNDTEHAAQDEVRIISVLDG